MFINAMFTKSLFTKASLSKLLFIALTSILLTACGGSDDIKSGKILLTCDVPFIPDAAGASCVAPPPIACAAPTVPDALNEKCVVGVDPNAPAPIYFPNANEAVVYYNRSAKGASNASDDPSYIGYRLHTWNDATCDAYAEPFDASDWGNGHEFDGIDPTYGAYWILTLKEDHNECGNFIIHVGTDDAGKALGGNNSKMPLMQEDETYQRMNFTFDGNPSIFEFPVVSLGKQPLAIEGFAAHWLDANTFAWNVDFSVISTVKLHYSATAGIVADDNDLVNGTAISLTEITLSDEQKAAAPLVANWTAFTGDWTLEQAKAMVKNQLVLVGYDGEGATVLATHVQADLILDDLYTKGEADADEATLGLVYSGENISAALWAPTAQQVKLNVYDEAKNLLSSNEMTEDPMTGIWRYSGDSSLDRKYYRFELTLYHHQNKAIEVIESTDPYSVSLSTNGMYSQFVNLADSDLQPDGWDGHSVATIENYEDAVIYEGHIRDFSARDESTSKANRGKFLAFTEVDSLPMQHLQKLVANGLTHFHMLPANDIATVNEDSTMIVDLTDTVADLCAIKADAPVCGVENDSTTLQAVFESYSPYTEQAAQLTEVMRDVDSFNWGYDPKHFNVPDGIYASNPDGVTRIVEMRAMIKALHDTGLRVVLDVVYNHTNSAGLWDNAVLDKIVPGYYHSRDVETGAVLNSTCCSDTALEHKMMNKLMVDSLKQWTEQYQFDGFRFDIMSQGSKAQMLAARDAVQAIDPDNHFYGEGWYKDSRGFERADQQNMAGTEIATYNDRIRDGIRNATLFNNDSASNYPFEQQDIVKLGMAGTLTDYVLKNFNGIAATGSSFGMYAKDPADVINYVSKHDNETLWDNLQFKLNFDMSNSDRVRAQNTSQAIILLSQGIPFLQMGGDFLRSKSLDRNTYDAGDWYNLVDFTFELNNWNKGLPLDKGGRSTDDLVSLAASPYTNVAMADMMFASSVFNEFLKIRTTSPLFRLTSATDIINRVGFHNIGKNQTQGLIVMSIDDGADLADLDINYDAVVVVVNGTNSEKTHTIATATGFSLHPVLMNSADAMVTGASFSDGSFTVPALTTAVFVKNQGESQGAGLSAYATSGAPDVVPYGDTVPFVRGDMNGWGEVDSLVYQGDGIYQAEITLSAGNYGFKLASADWSTINLGAPSTGGVVSEDETFTLLPGSNDNLSIEITVDGTYLFTLNAFDTTSPVLTVKNEEPFVGTSVFIRGGMNGWSEDNPLTYLGGAKYQATFTVAAGTYEFKIASADWSTVNMGAPSDDTEVLAGEKQLLVSGSNDNLSMTFETSGDYTFVFDAADLSVPTLAVYAAEMFGDTTVYIRGGMNGWGEIDNLTYTGNSMYSVEIEIATGDYEFKVASADWSTFNLGAPGDANVVSLGSPLTLVQNSQDNLSLSIVDAGIYIFTVSGPNPEEPKVMVTQKP
jgi:pullulanase